MRRRGFKRTERNIGERERRSDKGDRRGKKVKV